MNVLLNATTQPIETSSASQVPAKVPAHPSNATTPSSEKEPASISSPETSQPASAGYLQVNVTFRRDTAGRVYYVLTDPQTGRELRESPPEEVRKVGENIAQFLQQQQEEAAKNKHIEVQA